jgi:hypothetical protein
MQPSMDASAWIHQAQDLSWRQYVLSTPDAAMRTSPPHVYYPWQGFQRWQLQSPEGPPHQGSATPRCPEHQVFPRPTATVSRARWRDGNIFRGCASDQNRSREDEWTAVATTTSRPPSSRTEVSAPEGPARISTEGPGAAPTAPPERGD